MAPTTNELAFASSRPPSPLPELDEPTLETLEDELDLDKDLQDIGETEQVRASSLADVRAWLRAHSVISNCREDDSFLLRFIRIQKHKVPKACTTLENYLYMKKNNPQWFEKLDIRDEKIRELVDRGYVFSPPGRDLEGRRVVFSIGSALDPNRFSNSDAMRAWIITFEALMEEEDVQLKGFTYIFDCSGVSLSQLSIWSPAEATKVVKICEKNLPMRHRDINLVSLPFPMRAIFEFCKTLLSDKIRRRFSVHSSFDKVTSKMGDTSAGVLPLEYGGSTPLKEMTTAWAQHLEDKRSTLLRLDSVNIKETQVAKRKESKSSLWSYLPSFSSQSTAGSI